MLQCSQSIVMKSGSVEHWHRASMIKHIIWLAVAELSKPKNEIIIRIIAENSHLCTSALIRGLSPVFALQCCINVPASATFRSHGQVTPGVWPRLHFFDVPHVIFALCCMKKIEKWQSTVEPCVMHAKCNILGCRWWSESLSS